MERVGLVLLPGALLLSCHTASARSRAESPVTYTASWWPRAGKGWQGQLDGSCPEEAFQGSRGRSGKLDLAPSLLQEKHSRLLRNWLGTAPLQWKKELEETNM